MTRMAERRRARLRLAIATTTVGVLALAATLGAGDARAAESEPEGTGHAPDTASAAGGAAPAAASAAPASGAAASGAAARATSATSVPVGRREARGEFDVKVAPLAQDAAEGIGLGRMSLAKTFRGALVATSKGEMLTVDTKNPSSGAYAATERVTGVLDGRRGSFALVHVGTMSNGDYRLQISVVPDSGTEQLEGIDGTLAIEIRDGKHYYVLRYTLPER